MSTCTQSARHNSGGENGLTPESSFLGILYFGVIRCKTDNDQRHLQIGIPIRAFSRRSEEKGNPLTCLNDKVVYGLWKLPKLFEDDIVGLFAANAIDLAFRPNWKVKVILGKLHA